MTQTAYIELVEPSREEVVLLTVRLTDAGHTPVLKLRVDAAQLRSALYEAQRGSTVYAEMISTHRP